MKLTMKIALIISLFCATAFAGDMPGGGVAGDMPGGGIAGDDSTTIKTLDDKYEGETRDDLLIFVRDFLTKIFG